MGHRKRNAPRRGSLAYRPRARARRIVPALESFETPQVLKPTILGFAGYKVGCIHIITIDDREKTPNFGKPLFNASTIIATPPMTVYGFRAYTRVNGALQAFCDVYAKAQPKDIERLVKMQVKDPNEPISKIEKNLDSIVKFTALVYTRPRDAGLSQKKPFLFEITVGGGTIKERFEYLKSVLGKQIRVSEVFKPGMYVDVAAITKGKGFEGPVTRFGIKRKQHKSRKSVRAVGALNPWHPATIMYTVPRAGQHGFHKRIEYNKRILLVANPSETPITPKGGFHKYGVVNCDYIVLKGSVSGPVKRLVRLRFAVRPKNLKVQPPKILEASIPIGKG
ncbi:MAG: 50S ribosomal protein L3 [Thaumarchaeota archaeon]|nr:50S ribosomal protein L3 [Nitrososphaerota archaeon]